MMGTLRFSTTSNFAMRFLSRAVHSFISKLKGFLARWEKIRNLSFLCITISIANISSIQFHLSHHGQLEDHPKWPIILHTFQEAMDSIFFVFPKEIEFKQ